MSFQNRIALYKYRETKYQDASRSAVPCETRSTGLFAYQSEFWRYVTTMELTRTEWICIVVNKDFVKIKDLQGRNIIELHRSQNGSTFAIATL